MKKIFILLLICSTSLFSSDFARDKKDYYVHGQPLNDSLKFINIYMCFISNGLIKEPGKVAGLTNKGPYKVLTDSASVRKILLRDQSFWGWLCPKYR